MANANQDIPELSQKIHERLTALSVGRHRDLAVMLDRLVEGMEPLRAAGHRLRLCAAKQWLLAAGKVAEDLFYTLNALSYDVGRAKDLAAGLKDDPILGAAEVAAELRQAEREFGQLHYDRKNAFVSVDTEPITLEGVYLGEFQIRLLLSSRGTSSRHDDTYRIVALDPHPASRDEGVTHPHVREECLCAGDATSAIRTALAQGRICDFFLLVKSVLNKYNPSSPFAPLANWEGEGCHDCGHSFSGRASFACSACENDFCEDCISSCWCCSDDYCQECLSACSVCQERVCSGCVRRCPDCRKTICKTCLEEDKCPCHQQKEENDNEPASTTASQAAAS